MPKRAGLPLGGNRSDAERLHFVKLHKTQLDPLPKFAVLS